MTRVKLAFDIPSKQYWQISVASKIILVFREKEALEKISALL